MLKNKFISIGLHCPGVTELDLSETSITDDQLAKILTYPSFCHDTSGGKNLRLIIKGCPQLNIVRLQEIKASTAFGKYFMEIITQ